MSTKRIIQNRSSMCVYLPKGDCDLFGFQGGDPVVVSYLPGVGFLITRQYPGGQEPVQIQRLLSMKNYIDEMQNEHRRWLKVENANAKKEFLGLLKGGLIHEGMIFVAKLPESFYKSHLGPQEDPFPIDDIKLLEVPLETSKRVGRARKRPGRKGDRRSSVR